ncbi:MAG TPA: alkaline phosphatase family protein [Terriglobales bacterium]|nr:alkaline phosphatase family protein [Terriglobales bacterium]
MKRLSLFPLLAVGLMLISLLILAGCGGVAGNATNCNSGNCGTPGTPAGPPAPPPPPADITSVNHVVIMFQENRSFDSYFGQMTAYRTANAIPINSADGKINDLSSGKFSNNSPVAGPIAPYHGGSICTEDLTPAWAESHKMMDLQNPSAAGPSSPMNGFVANAYGLSQYALTLGITLADQTGRRPMAYFDSNDLNYYYFMASNFAMGDMFFSPVPARTTENRLFIHAATSQGHVHDPIGQLNAKTIWQELDAANLTWKIYVVDTNPATTPSLYTYLAFFSYKNSPGVLAKIVPIDQYFADAQAGTLPNVAFIEAGQFSGRDEHPSNFNPTTKTLEPVNVQTGAKYVSTIINAFMASPNYADGVFFWAMDEGGGLFDHVPPISVPNPDGIPPQDLNTDPTLGLIDPTGDFTITGFRVPNFIVSPFAKKNFVSHTPMDYTAYLTFIEKRWNLAPLTRRDGSMPDMQEFFDFAGKPWATPPAPPAQNTNGVCDFTKG